MRVDGIRGGGGGRRKRGGRGRRHGERLLVEDNLNDSERKTDKTRRGN
jgi:hypothetical protein